MADDPQPDSRSAARDDARARMIRKLGPAHSRSAQARLRPLESAIERRRLDAGRLVGPHADLIHPDAVDRLAIADRLQAGLLLFLSVGVLGENIERRVAVTTLGRIRLVGRIPVR